jgi:hypothetical protein
VVAHEHDSSLRAGHRNEQVEWHRARGLVHHDGVVALGALERCEFFLADCWQVAANTDVYEMTARLTASGSPSSAERNLHVASSAASRDVF